MQCHCLTNKNQRCKLQASKKGDDDNKYCWRHQNCARSIKDEISDTKPKQKVLKKTVTKTVRKTLKKTPKKTVGKTPRKTVNKNTKKSIRKVSRKTSSKSPTKTSQKAVKKSPGISICSLPAPVLANIVGNLNKWEVDKLCQTSKICDKNICKNKNLWTSLTKQKFNKSPQKDQDPRKFYYSQTTNLYGTGEDSFGKLGLPTVKGVSNTTKEEILIQKGVRYVSAGFDHIAFITINDELYVLGSNGYGQIGIGIPQTNVPVKIMDNVKKVVALETSTFILDYLGNLYMLGDYIDLEAEEKTLVMSSIMDIGEIEDNIYMITNENHYLTTYEIGNAKTKKFHIYPEYSVGNIDMNKYFHNNKTSVNLRDNMHQIGVSIKGVHLSTEIIQFYPAERDLDDNCHYIFYSVLLKDNRLLFDYIFDECDDNVDARHSDIISNVKTFYANENGILWADLKGKLYFMPISGPEKYQNLEIESSPVVKILKDKDSAIILTVDGNLFLYNPIENIRTDVSTDVVDFDVNPPNKYFIKYLFLNPRFETWVRPF